MSFSDLSEMSDTDFKALSLHELSEVAATSETLPKHPEFYVTDLITSKVGNTLFRVERHLLAASSIFHDIMKEDEHLEGSKDECVTISNVSELQMESFLECLYYPNARFRKLHDFLLDILEPTFKQSKFTPRARIVWARQCRVVKWLKQVYAEIVCREDGLSEEEAKELGWEKTLALYRVREKLSALRTSSTRAEASGESVVQDLTKDAEELVKTETCLNQEDFGPAQSSSLYRATGKDIQGLLFRTPLRMMRGAKILDECIAAIPSGHPLSTDKNPLELDFIATQPGPIKPQLDLKAWVQALRVATFLGHDTARDFMTTMIEADFKSKDPIDLIEIANEFNLDHWLPAQYERLAKRSKKLTEAEMRRLGYRASSEVAHKRELEAFRRGEQRRASNATAGLSLQEIITTAPVQKLLKSNSRASRALR
ncbi:hypothetical protein FRC04_002178 [Tulasnella sp. 424]|nr:hypothetical protein FRC04_002178 [Tulasnella sp. 424]